MILSAVDTSRQKLSLWVTGWFGVWRRFKKNQQTKHTAKSIINSDAQSESVPKVLTGLDSIF